MFQAVGEVPRCNQCYDNNSSEKLAMISNPFCDLRRKIYQESGIATGGRDKNVSCSLKDEDTNSPW